MSSLIKSIATRESYGQALLELGYENPNIIVYDADLAMATKTNLFRGDFPDRFFDAGIAEDNMVGMAAGMAATGKIVFASSFAMFLAGRAYEQIRNTIGYPGLNVKLCATHAGLSVGEDGASHQCLEDIGLMKVIPGMTVVCPCDDIETRAAIRAIAKLEGPCYVRLGREKTPVVSDYEGYSFTLGKGNLVRKGDSVTIVATGIMLAVGLDVCDRLNEIGINAELINIHTIKPLDEQIILDSAAKTKCVVTLEEHSIINGLGSSVADVLSEKQPTRMLKIGVNDLFGTSGASADVMREYHLDAESITKEILQWGVGY